MPLHGRANLNAAINKLVNEKKSALRAVMFQGLQNIQLGTPVDEGTARNNWFLTTGSPSNEETASVSGNSVSLTAMPIDVSKEPIYFTNNLPYIGRLEYDGYSPQAAMGWVRREVQVIGQAVRNI